MYSVKLDERNYFTGSYAKVGSIPGGVMVNKLPSDMTKCKCYQWITKEMPITKKIPVIDPDTGENVLDNEGNVIFTETEEMVPVTDWFLDEAKAIADEEAYKVEVIRVEREKAFLLIDKCQLSLVYADLTVTQQEELKTYRTEWLDAPATKVIPIKPNWLI